MRRDRSRQNESSTYARYSAPITRKRSGRWPNAKKSTVSHDPMVCTSEAQGPGRTRPSAAAPFPPASARLTDERARPCGGDRYWSTMGPERPTRYPSSQSRLPARRSASPTRRLRRRPDRSPFPGTRRVSRSERHALRLPCESSAFLLGIDAPRVLVGVDRTERVAKAEVALPSWYCRGVQTDRPRHHSARAVAPPRRAPPCKPHQDGGACCVRGPDGFLV